VAVYCGRTQSFYGIRSKFGKRFITNEYHWDTGEPYGTCEPILNLDILLPEDIELTDDIGTYCKNCKRDVYFEQAPTSDDNWVHVFEEPVGVLKGWCDDLVPCSKGNDKFLDWTDHITTDFGNKTYEHKASGTDAGSDPA
jgi:hypothetical protein